MIIFKNFYIDKKYLKISIYILIVVTILIIVSKTVENFTDVTLSIKNGFENGLKMISPFIYGFCLAYLLNPLINFFEKYLKNIIKNKKLLRNLSIFLSYTFVCSCIIITMIYFIPEISSSISNFVSTIPENINNLEKNLHKFLNKITFIDPITIIEFLTNLLKSIIDTIQNIPLFFSKYFKVFLSGTFNILSLFINIILGIVISFYLLANKEGLISYIKKILYSFFKEKKVNKFLFNSKRVDDIFKNFIIGKTIDSLIIGILCFIGLTILKTPFITLISVIIGVTNMIPYFGPIIGAVPAIIIVLLTMPSKALLLGIFILILQQFDGIILGPKILGQTVGISPIWIILSITIGGTIMGPLGMFLGVPIFASIKLFFCEYIESKYTSKYGNTEIEYLSKENDR